MILRSGNACSVLASLAARPTASLSSQHSLAPSHCSTLAKGKKENDDVTVHCFTAAHLQSYCSSPLAGVWCRRRWWPDFALRGISKKLAVGACISAEWGGIDGTLSTWHGVVRSVSPIRVFYVEGNDMFPFPPVRPVRISRLAVEFPTSLASKARCARLLRLHFRRAMASAVALSGTSRPDDPLRNSLPASGHSGRAVRGPVPVLGRQFLVASFNCRSATCDGSILSVASWADARKISVVALQETRRSFDEDIVIGEGWRFINFAASKGVGGTGVVMSPDASRRLTKIDGSSQHFRAKFGFFTVIGVHTPTAVDYEHREQFFSLVSDILPRDSEHVFIIGDFNSRLDERRLSPLTRRAKEQFLDFLSQNSLTAVNPPAYTFTSATGKYSTLDYVVCRRRYRSSVFDLRVLRNSPLPSDHFPIVATLCLHFATVEISELKQCQDFSVLRDSEVRRQFSRNFDACVSYSDFCTAFETAKQLIPPSHSTAKARTWKTDLVHNIMKMEANLDSRNLSKLLANQDNAQVTSLIHEYSSLLSANPRLAWRFVRQSMFSGPSTTFPAQSEEERLQRLTAHFAALFSPDGGPGPPNWGQFHLTPLFKVGPFTNDELSAALSSLSSGKSPGFDGIPNEVLRLVEIRQALLSVVNLALRDGIPDEWHRTALVPLPKKGDLADPGNWRGIALMQTSAKLFNLLLLRRLRAAIDKYLMPSQNGFRPQRSTVQHIMAVKLLLGDARLRNMSLHGCFIDFRKAFDSVSWHSVEAALQFWHVPAKIITSIMSIYKGHFVQVRCGSACGTQIPIQKGVLQGDTLAPFLFVLIVDQILRKLPQERGIDVSILPQRLRSSTRSLVENTRVAVVALEYADDILLLSHTSSNLQELFDIIEREGKKVGLFINMGKAKTERFFVNDAAGSVKNDKGEEIPIVDGYKYLGVKRSAASRGH